MGAALAYQYDFFEDTYQEKVSEWIETRVRTPRLCKLRFGENGIKFRTILPPRTQAVKIVDGYRFSMEVSQISWKNIIKTRINKTVHLQKFEEWGETKPSEKTLGHAHKLVDLCSDDTVLGHAEVTTGGNGTIMLSWNSQDVMATLDVGEKTFTYSVISRVNYRILGGGKYEATRDAEVEGLYRLLR